MGYTRCDNDILDALYSHKMSARELRAVLYVMRESTGRNKPTWKPSMRSLAIALDEYKGIAEKTIEALVRGGVLLVSDEGMCVNPDTSAWSMNTVAYQQIVGDSQVKNQPATNSGPTGDQQIVGKQASKPSDGAGSVSLKKKERNTKEKTPLPPEGGGVVPFEDGHPPIDPELVDAPEDFVTSTGTRPAPKPTKARRAPRGGVYSEKFNAWWAKCPLPGSKAETWERWEQFGLEDDAALLAEIDAAMAAEDARRKFASQKGVFFPRAKACESWLFNRRWEQKHDDPEGWASNIVPITSAQKPPQTPQEKFLEWAKGINPYAKTDEERVRVYVERAWVVNKVRLDLDAALVSLEAHGVDATLLTLRERLAGQTATAN